MTQSLKLLARAFLRAEERDQQVLRRAIAEGSGIPSVYFGDLVPDRCWAPWEGAGAAWYWEMERREPWEGYTPWTS
jgi:hypothetical protein